MKKNSGKFGVVLGITLVVIQSIVANLLGAVAHIPYIVFLIIYYIWFYIAIWRCALNAEWQIWGYIVRILIAFNIVSIIISIGFWFFIGSDLIKTAECGKELHEYVAKGGKDTEGFNKQCFERKLNNKEGLLHK